MGHVVVSMNREDEPMSHRLLCQPADRLSQVDPPTKLLDRTPSIILAIVRAPFRDTHYAEGLKKMGGPAERQAPPNHDAVNRLNRLL